MIEGIFYNVFILGTIISFFVLPILIFLTKNKYKYNFESIYKIFTVILLLLLLPINSFDFSKVKEAFIVQKQVHAFENEAYSSNMPLEFEFQNENLIIEFDNRTNNTINVKNNIFFNIYNIVPYAWVGIAILLMAYNILNYLILLYKLKNSNSIRDNNIENAIFEISKSIGLKQKVRYEISSNVTTPMTIGIFKKKIVLPYKILENNGYEVILKHELFHIKNKDIEYKFLLLLLNCIYWFNPIIYNFTNQVDEILELNCDENVLKNKEEAYRIEYAKVLLTQIEQNRNKEYSFSINFANRRKNIMNRFSNIVNNQEKKSTISLAGILTILVILILFAVICVPNINFATIEEKIISQNEVIVEDNVDKNNSENNVNENNVSSEIDNEVAKLVKEDESNVNSEADNDIPKLVETNENVEFEIPLKDSYTVTSRFGMKTISGEKVTHTGFDLAGESGINIYASASGIVKFAGWKGSYGYLVVIEHNDSFQTYYAQCQELCVEEGQEVKKGDVIAKLGSTGNSTGPHLHFEIRENGKAVNPANYLSF